MSLEKALQENTEAVKALTVAINGFAAGQNGAAMPPAAEQSEKTTTKATKSETKKEAVKEDTKAADSGIPYEDVKNKTLELVKAKGRDVVLALVKDFGEDNASAKDLKTEQYADYMTAVDKLLAGEDDVA